MCSLNVDALFSTSDVILQCSKGKKENEKTNS